MQANRMRRILGVTVMVAVGLSIGRANAANDRIVKGTVMLPPDAGSPHDALVYLEGHIGSPTPTKMVIDQKDSTFIPHVVGVVVGGTVEFRNSDTILHNVFSTSPAKHFDLGMFGRGESRTVSFDTPGMVEVRCNVHPKMHAFILVSENNYFATPDERGDFEINGLPAGRYKLHAWHEGFPEKETWVNLEDATLRTVEMRLQK